MLQFLYLAIYGAALYRNSEIFWEIFWYFGKDFFRGVSIASAVTNVLLIAGCAGIPVRLYLLASVGFDDPESGLQFRKIFPYLFLLDELWALSPLLLIHAWPAGVAMVCVATLAYLPMSQRTLMLSAYRW
jgi:hypothetical protein